MSPCCMHALPLWFTSGARCASHPVVSCPARWNNLGRRAEYGSKEARPPEQSGAGHHRNAAVVRSPSMSRFIPAAFLALTVTLGTACARTSHVPEDAPMHTVLKVENQGFPDMNIFVLPETSNR